MSTNKADSQHKQLTKLQSRLGYKFTKFENIERALTHSSVRIKTDYDFHYERLEFLGDRVLGLVVADMLFEKFTEANEGELSLRLNSMVNGNTLAEISDEIGLHEFIRTGGDLKKLTGRRMQNIRADVLEAVIGSIFIDGGLIKAREFIARFWSDRLYDEAAARRDSKTELQEWSHAKRLGTPKYWEKSRSGPDHDPHFTVIVQVGSGVEIEGTGSSKRAAEQAAARELLLREGVWNAEGAAK